MYISASKVGTEHTKIEGRRLERKYTFLIPIADNNLTC